MPASMGPAVAGRKSVGRGPRVADTIAGGCGMAAGACARRIPTTEPGGTRPAGPPGRDHAVADTSRSGRAGEGGPQPGRAVPEPTDLAVS
jgi:hypothetical protein